MAHCGSSEVLIVGGVGCMLFCILIPFSAEYFVFLVVIGIGLFPGKIAATVFSSKIEFKQKIHLKSLVIKIEF